jgi:hypothetical protein
MSTQATNPKESILKSIAEVALEQGLSTTYWTIAVTPNVSLYRDYSNRWPYGLAVEITSGNVDWTARKKFQRNSRKLVGDPTVDNPKIRELIGIARDIERAIAQMGEARKKAQAIALESRQRVYQLAKQFAADSGGIQLKLAGSGQGFAWLENKLGVLTGVSMYESETEIKLKVPTAQAGELVKLVLAHF